MKYFMKHRNSAANPMRNYGVSIWTEKYTAARRLFEDA